MSGLVLAVILGQLPSAPEALPRHDEVLELDVVASPADRVSAADGCEICLATYVRNPAMPGGLERIRDDCGFTLLDMPRLRARQRQISNEGTFSVQEFPDLGTWYGPHRIEFVVPVMQPSCP